MLAKPARRSLLEVLSRLPAYGVGARVTRATWEPHGDSYWEVVRVKPDPAADGSAGEVRRRCGSRHA